ncbi:hypothetical protein [Pulveribacter sp.]|uniref:hypothetical protein n=1 Tax=Pulveribacter sp. TaxID=2678893 RepID=UPI0028A9AA5C|nr:hypothetical protein [Pulveribacter sp.]
MKRSSLRKPSQVRENAAESSWRDHPVVVASIAVAATLTLMGGVVFPLLTAHLSSEIAELRKVVDAKSEEIGGLKKQIEGLDLKLSEERAAVQKIENENTKISEKFRLATIENPFVLPSGYPKGLDTIRIGSTPTEVEAAFLDVPIDKKNEDYWSIDVTHPIFSSVTYYFGFNNREITHILFHNKIKGPVRDEDFLPLVKRYFGRPRISIDENHLWVTGGVHKERISVEDGGLFLILGKDVLPHWITRALARCERSDVAPEGDLKAFCEHFAKARKQPNKER